MTFTDGPQRAAAISAAGGGTVYVSSFFYQTNVKNDDISIFLLYRFYRYLSIIIFITLSLITTPDDSKDTISLSPGNNPFDI
ncbi:MAG: hypothetical protein K5900_07790 [Butyrivibrio sp.]|nr:hypothetical protein [Butyrivibrio sp.]